MKVKKNQGELRKTPFARLITQIPKKDYTDFWTISEISYYSRGRLTTRIFLEATWVHIMVVLRSLYADD
jgi:hypothetical protein